MGDAPASRNGKRASIDDHKRATKTLLKTGALSYMDRRTLVPTSSILNSPAPGPGLAAFFREERRILTRRY
jgi:hypothetical protein